MIDNGWKGGKEDGRLHSKVRAKRQKVVRTQYERLRPFLDERGRRLWAANNWRGRPLANLGTVVNLIANTRTSKGLTIESALDQGTYEKGIKISGQEMAELSIRPDNFHGEWNYSVHLLLPLGIALVIRMIPEPLWAECREKVREIVSQRRAVSWAAAVVIVGIWIGVILLLIKLLVF